MAKKTKQLHIIGSFDDIIKASVSGNPKPKPKGKPYLVQDDEKLREDDTSPPYIVKKKKK